VVSEDSDKVISGWEGEAERRGGEGGGGGWQQRWPVAGGEAGYDCVAGEGMGRG
jgi:hypothetical protein